jgi:uncharacterized phage-associated protein
MSSARSVAKELVRLSKCGQVPDPLTSYRLQALLYYSQAWSLVLRDSEIFPDQIVCLEDGPAVPSFASVAEGAGSRLVCSTAFDQDPALDQEDEALFLGHLWGAYGYLSPSGLFASMQKEPPFLKARKELATCGRGVIDTNDLRESFARRPGIPSPLETYRLLREDKEKEAELAILTSPPLDVAAIWKGTRSVTPSASKR